MQMLTLFAESWTLRLFAVSLQGAALTLGLHLLLRVLPSVPAAIRSRLWWLVCMQLLLGLVWPEAMKVHLSRAAPTYAAISETIPMPAYVANTAKVRQPFSATAEAAPSVASKPIRRLHWQSGLLLLWMAGAAAGLLLLLREYHSLRRLLRRSSCADPWLQQLLEGEARGMSLRRAPGLRIAPDIRSPQLVGLLRPIVLMPQDGLSDWRREDLVLALRHELMHLRRHDLWWGWGPVLAQRLFFFNPAAVFAAREFALAREAAVDEALLRQPDVSARRYGELLLRLGASPAGPAVMATASPSFRMLHRRLTMMNALSTRGRTAKITGTLAMLLVAGGSLPLSASPTPPASPAAAPAIPAAPAAPSAPVAQVPSVPAIAGVPTVPAVPAAPPKHARAHAGSHNNTYVFSDSKSGTTLDIDKDDDGRDTKIIVSGEGKDAQILKITQDPASHATHLWYQDGNKSYVLDDAAIMAKVSAVLESTMQQLGEQQGELGEQQGLLSGQQAELGAEQARIGAEQARVSAEMAQASQRAADEKAIADLERQQEALGRQQDELGKRQDEIGKQQDELGKRQDEIGKQQDEAARQAGQQIRELMRQAIDGGLAKPAAG